MGTLANNLFVIVFFTCLLIILPFILLRHYHSLPFRRLTRRVRILFNRHIVRQTIPISVNYHFTRKCNATCKFCFHTELSSYHEPLASAQHALRLLHASGMDKLNFAGGEPFLYHKWLGDMCKFAKEEIGLQSVSIVSNGTRVSRGWFEKYGRDVDILAVSCDSFVPATNLAIGRAERGASVPFDNVGQLFRIRDWCAEFGVKFKLNTVVCSLNWDEDMRSVLSELTPFRWKVFQVLIVEGENESEARMRDARGMRVSDEEFDVFCQRHEGVKGFTPEANEVMKSSYLILDEYLHFLDKGDGSERHSESVLKVGVQKALGQIKWDEESFRARGGVYDWSRRAGTQGNEICGSNIAGVEKAKLEW